MYSDNPRHQFEEAFKDAIKDRDYGHDPLFWEHRELDEEAQDAARIKGWAASFEGKFPPDHYTEVAAAGYRAGL